MNYLIYRYLQESGFSHSSFTFGQESGVTRSSVAGTKIPPGALIVQLQRALNYVQAEVCLSEDGSPVDYEDLGGVDALSLIDSVQPDVCEQVRLFVHHCTSARLSLHIHKRSPAPILGQICCDKRERERAHARKSESERGTLWCLCGVIVAEGCGRHCIPQTVFVSNAKGFGLHLRAHCALCPRIA